ncbi:MAG: Gfo/Idh/MocA family oxidoreductase [Oculatellaceae cyanobacterium bins.114]|nr:Gfo/Idh/MocA family oxidoreductase [Oculatellaceae cyanobacterium bins.114]
MQQQPLGIAILGAGRWGVHLIRNFLNHPQARIVAIADLHRDRLQALAQQFNLSPDIQLITDWQLALQAPAVEAVAIATPAATHFQLIQAALQQGHHVLAEKPLTLNEQDCIELCRLAEQQQRQLVIDHTYLFHPAVQQGKQAIQTNLVGELRYGYATRTHLGPVRQDVDALWDLAIHDIAILNHWLGQIPRYVQAQGTIWLQPQSYNPVLFPHGLSDLVWVTLTYPSGFQAFVHLCWCNPDKQRRLCVTGDQGTLIFDEMMATTPLTVQQGVLERSPQHFTPTNQHRHTLPLEANEPLQQVCDHFITCARQNIPSSISSGWVGTQLVKILSALTTSLNSGGQRVEITDS